MFQRFSIDIEGGILRERMQQNSRADAEKGIDSVNLMDRERKKRPGGYCVLEREVRWEMGVWMFDCTGRMSLPIFARKRSLI